MLPGGRADFKDILERGRCFIVGELHFGGEPLPSPAHRTLNGSNDTTQAAQTYT